MVCDKATSKDFSVFQIYQKKRHQKTARLMFQTENEQDAVKVMKDLEEKTAKGLAEAIELDSRLFN